MLSEASELAERFDDDLLRARVAECRGHSVLYHGDLPAAIELLEEARPASVRCGSRSASSTPWSCWPRPRSSSRIPATATSASRRWRSRSEYGAMSSKAYALWCVGVASWRAGEYDRAVETAGVRAAVPTPPRPDRHRIRRPGAVLVRRLHLARRAGSATAGSIARRLEDQRGQDRRDQPLQPGREGVAGSGGRGLVGASAAFERAFADGASYSFDEAVALALGEGDGGSPPSSRSTGRRAEAPGGLTRRELEIAGLLAEGLTNREIAARLVIAQRTAETHVDHILSKLGMTSRAQVAAWVAEQRPTRSWPGGERRTT